MTTGSINYSPDYKSKKEPKLPEDWGLVKVVCADGAHRFLPDAPKCGCGEKVNPTVERARLEREVIRCAKLFTTIKDGEINATWSDRVALSANDLDDAVRKLLDLESQIKK